jgi:hypothetical protein
MNNQNLGHDSKPDITISQAQAYFPCSPKVDNHAPNKFFIDV